MHVSLPVLHYKIIVCRNYVLLIHLALKNVILKYRIILKSLRDFRPLRYSSRDGHEEGEYVNRGRDTPNFCPTLQVLHMSTLGDEADVNPVIKFLPHTTHVCGGTETWSLSPSVEMLPFGMTIPATIP